MDILTIIVNLTLWKNGNPAPDVKKLPVPATALQNHTLRWRHKPLEITLTGRLLTTELLRPLLNYRDFTTGHVVSLHFEMKWQYCCFIDYHFRSPFACRYDNIGFIYRLFCISALTSSHLTTIVPSSIQPPS